MTNSLRFPTPVIPDPKSGPALRWGVLAPGIIAGRVVSSLHHQSRQQVIAVGSRSFERAERFRSLHGIERAYRSYDQLVADPDVDAVYVASPHSFHAEHARLAIAAGKHVLVEKPLARNAAEARAVFTAGRNAGVVVMEAMWTRFLPQASVIRKLLESGYLGDILTVMADHGQRFEFNPTGRLFAPSLAGGAMLDLGIYPLSLIHMVMGPTADIAAAGTLTGTGVDETVSAILRYPSGQGLLSTTLSGRSPNTAAIVGSVVRLELMPRFFMPTTMILTHHDGRTAALRPSGLSAGDGRVYQFLHFAQLVAEQRMESPVHGAEDVVETLRMSDRIRHLIGAIPREEDPLRSIAASVAGDVARRWQASTEIEDFELAQISRPEVPDGLLNVMRRGLEDACPGVPRNELSLLDGYMARYFWQSIREPN